MKKFFLPGRFFFLAVFFCTRAIASDSDSKGGVGIDATRIIYDENNKFASVGLRNTTTNTPFLMQSFITEYTGVGKLAPFIVTPPLLRLDGGKRSIVRIERTGGSFPQDRESVFAFITKAIPASDPEVQAKDRVESSLPISISTRIKLFWRPRGIKGNAKLAESSLQFRIANHEVVEVYNPSAFHVSLNEMKFNGKSVVFDDEQLEMLPPFTKINYKMNGVKTGKAEWQVINDLGGVDTFTGDLK